MTQPVDQPPNKKKAKGQASPYSLFFAAFLAYLFGAPTGLVLFLIGLGIIFWRVQAAAKNMAKLPPLPPRQADQPEQANAGSPDLQETAWGRNPVPSAQPPAPPPWFPQEVERERAAQTRSTSIETSKETSTETFDDLFPTDPVTQPDRSGHAGNTSGHSTPTPSPYVAPQPSVASFSRPDRPSVDSASSPLQSPRNAPHRRPGLGVNLSTQDGLRHAIVAMTVLGPCRALDPYQDQPLDTGLPTLYNQPSSRASSNQPPTQSG